MGVWRVELLLVVVCLGGVVCLAEYTRTTSYEGEVLIKCSGLKREVIQSLLEEDGLDVWHVGAGGTVDFRISNEEFLEMKGDLPECRVERSVEELVREMEEKIHKESLNKTQLDWFEEYHQYTEIVDWYQDLANKYPNLVKFIPSIGKSLEGRDMPAIHITAAEEPRQKIYFQCQIHAREWISGATCMFIANSLTESYSNGGDERVKQLLDEVELVIVPLVNPDGYAYTWSGDRLWRKNRRPGTPCYGVDLNRNYPDHWNEGGSSSNPCSEVYHGSGPASEPETQNTINYFKSVTDPDIPLIGAIDWHSFGQLILRPYGWTDEDSPDEAQLKELGDLMSESIYSVHGSRYTNQKSIGLYPTTGSADDWFYSDDANEGNGEYRAAAYTIELRDTGSYGFLLPPSEIIPTGEENVAGVLVFMEELTKNPLKKK